MFSLAPLLIAIYVAVLGYLPYNGDSTYAGYANEDHIMSSFAYRFGGKHFAYLFTSIVILTLFGRCFALLIGYIQLPCVAAKDGMFFKWFAHEHSTYKELPDYSALACVLVTLICCFFPLNSLIDGLLCTRILTQFLTQSIGVMIYRRTHPETPRPYKIPFYPLPNLISTFGWIYIVGNSDNFIFRGGKATLEVCVIYLLIGIIVFVFWAKRSGKWPYKEKKRPTSRSQLLDLPAPNQPPVPIRSKKELKNLRIQQQHKHKHKHKRRKEEEDKDIEKNESEEEMMMENVVEQDMDSPLLIQ